MVAVRFRSPAPICASRAASRDGPQAAKKRGSPDELGTVPIFGEVVLEFEGFCENGDSPRFPAHIAQSVEHFLGKEEVTGSIPVVGSMVLRGWASGPTSQRVESTH